jgi:hypothetical protein
MWYFDELENDIYYTVSINKLRTIVYETLREAGIEQPRYAVKHNNNRKLNLWYE